MRTHTKTNNSAANRTHSMPVPNALAHQAQLRSALLRAGVQPLLHIGPANNPLEREADAAAKHVMQMPQPLLHPPPASRREVGGEGAPVQIKASIAPVAQQWGSSDGAVQRKEAQAEVEPQSASNAVGNTAAKPEIKLRQLGGAPVETYGHVAIRLLWELHFLKDLHNLKPDLESERASLISWIDKILSDLGNKQKTNKLEEKEIILHINHLDTVLPGFHKDVHNAKQSQIRDALRREYEAAQAAAKHAKDMELTLDDKFRAAYHAGSKNTLKEVVSAAKKAISVTMHFKTLVAQINNAINSLPPAMERYQNHWMYTKGLEDTIDKCTKALRVTGRGLSFLNVALTVFDRNKQTTEARQGVKAISEAITIIVDLSSIAGLSLMPHFGLYNTLYVKPALKVISKQIEVLANNLSNTNRVSVEVTGNLLYPNVEPGGQEMYRLMVKLMRAKDESEFPKEELTPRVKDYLFEHREKLSIGTETDVPIEGIRGFRKFSDGLEGRRWLFYNRHRIWAMFYGSMTVSDESPLARGMSPRTLQ